jgi:microcystin-dependent protein
MPFWKWSHAASSNANVDQTINWAEGMAPSAVNDSARAMMARIAEWRDDISGTIGTSGTAAAYTLASNQGFDNFPDMNGAMIALVPHVTSGATVTLNVDGLGAKPLRSAPGVELPSGVMVQGTPYVVTYNNADGAFYLQGFTINPYVVPIGAFLDYCGTTAPNSAFVLPYGQAISRTAYSALFALVGTTFGVGDGSTTFNVPDLRGRICAALDNMGGTAAGRIGTISTDNGTISGTMLGSTGGQATHTQTLAEMATYTPAGTVTITAQSNIPLSSGAQGLQQGPSSYYRTDGGVGVTASFSGTTHTNSAAMVILPPTIMVGKILRIV